MAQDQVELWEAAAAAFDERHRLVRVEHDGLPTPSREFDIAALIGHVIGNQVQSGRMLGGAAADDASCRDARAAMAEVLARPDSLVGSVDHPRARGYPASPTSRHLDQRHAQPRVGPGEGARRRRPAPRPKPSTSDRRHSSIPTRCPQQAVRASDQASLGRQPPGPHAWRRWSPAMAWQI